MKKNIIALILLIIAYIAVCTANLSYARQDESEVYFNKMDKNPGKTAELSLLTMNNNSLVSGDIIDFSFYYKNITNSYNSKDTEVWILTNNKNYKKAIEMYDLKGEEKIKIIEDYKTGLPIFDDKKYKYTADHFIKEGYDSSDDLMVITAINNEICENFYIDGRFADFSNIINNRFSTTEGYRSLTFDSIRANAVFKRSGDNKYILVNAIEPTYNEQGQAIVKDGYVEVQNMLIPQEEYDKIYPNINEKTSLIVDGKEIPAGENIETDAGVITHTGAVETYPDAQ